MSPMVGRKESCKKRAVRRERIGTVRNRTLNHHCLAFAKRRECRHRVSFIPVQCQVVRPHRIEHDEHNRRSLVHRR